MLPTLQPSEGEENTDTAETAESTLFPLQRTLRRSIEYVVALPPFIFMCSVSLLSGGEEFASIFSNVVVGIAAGVGALASIPSISIGAGTTADGFATECTLTEYLGLYVM